LGVVFRAEAPQHKRPVALKAMLPTLAVSDSARQRFLREAQAAAAIKHDHIVTIYQVGEDRGVPFLAMEFLKGEALDERLRRLGQLPPAEVLRIGREIADGLAAAHEQGLIHRDIKPANVWLEGERGRVKILDFGLARAASDESQLTQQGAIIGTPAYMSPEQAASQTVDARSDLFSLGCVLYRLCTVQPPFQGKDVIATLMAVATEQPPPPADLDPDVPPALSELVMQLLAKDPGDRPRSARAVVKRIEAIERDPTAAGVARSAPPGRAAWSSAADSGGDHRTIQEAPPSRRKRPRKAKRPVWPWVAGAAGAIAVVLVAVLIATRTRSVAPGNTANVAQGNQPTAPGGAPPANVPPDGPGPKPAPGGVPPDGSGPKPFPANPFEADRAAAEWVLKLGGSAEIAFPPEALNPGIWHRLADLPQKPFRLVGVSVGQGRDRVTDADLLNLGTLKNLRNLDLTAAPVTDTGLAHLKSLTGLQRLYLQGTKVTDAGLAHFKGLRELGALELGQTGITGAGLAQLRDLPGLFLLALSDTPVTDADLAQLKEFKALMTVRLAHTRITDAGLAHLAGIKTLIGLDLSDTRVTDIGLGHLQKHQSLQMLDLRNTTVTDAGLAHLAGMKRLNSLNLNGTQITGAGLAHLKEVKTLRQLHLRGLRNADAGLDNLQGMKNLLFLDLSDAEVSDKGLTQLKGLPNLHDLLLRDTQVTDAGVARLKAALPQCGIQH
jgi:hypothetical protein